MSLWFSKKLDRKDRFHSIHKDTFRKKINPSNIGNCKAIKVMCRVAINEVSTIGGVLLAATKLRMVLIQFTAARRKNCDGVSQSQSVLCNWTMEDYWPVQRHEDQGVDGDKDGDDDEVLDCGAPQGSKGPDRGESVVCCCEGNTEQYEQQIRQLKILKLSIVQSDFCHKKTSQVWSQLLLLVHVTRCIQGIVTKCHIHRVFQHIDICRKITKNCFAYSKEIGLLE